MSTTTLHLEHRFADALPELAVDWQAETAPGPTLLALDEELAGDLGLDPAWLRTEEGLRLLTGEQPPAGARPVAQGYAGHQFGGYSPRLGDGRALLLGELTDREGRLRDLHLKGSGRTPWSRGGDGLAVVGPMLREHLVSAAMHALGVPTTRSLGVVATGRAVQREQPLPGAVLARVASSHLRVGTLQYAVALDHQQPGAGLVRRVVEHAATRHHPHVLDADVPALALLEEVTRVQAELVASWMSVGFVHGVMNTDNVTLSGETIDYGPCAFLDGFDQAAVFSSIDTGGRYAFGQQPAITQWNLARMAETLLPLVVEHTARQHQCPGRRIDERRGGMAEVLAPIRRRDLVLDQRVDGLGVGHTQQRFGKAHQHDAFLGRQAVAVHELRDERLALALGLRLADERESAPRHRVAGGGRAGKLGPQIGDEIGFGTAGEGADGGAVGRLGHDA